MAQHKNQGKLKSKEQEIIRQYVEEKIGFDKLGKIHGVSGNSIHKLLVRNNIPIRPKKTISPENIKKIIELYTSKTSKNSMDKIAKEFGMSAAGVLKILRKHNVQSRTAEEAHRKYPINEDFFDNIDTEEKAYFLGFLYADGCNQMANFWSVVLSLETSDQEILHKFANLIYKETAHAREQIKIRNREHEGKGVEATLYMNSKHICQQMEKLGCVSRKTFLLQYPDWMPERLHRHFVRGYFDGDGSINNEQEKVSGCTITSTKQFLEGIQKIGNINSSIRKHDSFSDKNTYTLSYSGNRNILLFLHWIYSDSKIYLQRKYFAYLRFCEKMHDIDEKTIAGTRGFNKSNLAKTSTITF